MRLARASAGALASHLSPLAKGLLLTVTIAMAARLLGTTTPLPPLFFTLILGMAFSWLGTDPRCAAGIDFSGRNILRIGVALLGVQITFGDMTALGLGTASLVVVTLVSTLVPGSFVARGFGCSRHGSMVSAGAVAICGASAALAIAAALPKDSVHEEEVARTVAGITVIGTLAMLTLPALGFWFGFDAKQMGILLGGSIHEVAQAVAAGFAVSDDAGQWATLVKLLRVACLGLAVLIISVAARSLDQPARLKAPLLPGFLIMFMLLATISSFEIIPDPLQQAANEISRWCLLIAIAALGIRTSGPKLSAAGPRPLLAIGANSILLTGLVLTEVWLVGN